MVRQALCLVSLLSHTLVFALAEPNHFDPLVKETLALSKDLNKARAGIKKELELETNEGLIKQKLSIDNECILDVRFSKRDGESKVDSWSLERGYVLDYSRGSDGVYHLSFHNQEGDSGHELLFSSDREMRKEAEKIKSVTKICLEYKEKLTRVRYIPAAIVERETSVRTDTLNSSADFYDNFSGFRGRKRRYGFDQTLYDLLGEETHASAIDEFTKSHETLNDVSFLHRGEIARKGIYRVLSAAKDRLFMSVPYWYDDYEGDMLLQALYKKRRERPDLDIRFMNDDVSQASVGDRRGKYVFRFINDLTKGQALVWGQWRWHERWSKHRTKNHLHEKLFIADGKLMVMGGTNVGNDYLSVGRQAWHDDSIAIRGPAVSQAEEYYLRSWAIGQMAKSRRRVFPRSYKKIYEIMQEIYYGSRGASKLGAADKALRAQIESGKSRYQSIVERATTEEVTKHPPYDIKKGHKVRFFVDQPLVDKKFVKGQRRSHSKYLETLSYVAGHTRNRAWFSIPYLSISKEMEKILLDMAARGVDVRVMANSYETLDVSPRWLFAGAFPHVKRLVKGGVRVFLWRGHQGYYDLEDKFNCRFEPRAFPGAALHSKLALFDDGVSFVGSHNFNVRSQSYNSEAVAMIRSFPIARSLQRLFRKAFDLPSESKIISCGDFNFQRPRRTEEITKNDLRRLKKKLGAPPFRNMLLGTSKHFHQLM